MVYSIEICELPICLMMVQSNYVMQFNFNATIIKTRKKTKRTFGCFGKIGVQENAAELPGEDWRNES